MRFDTKELNPGTWFYFDEDNLENGGVCVRKVNAKKLKEIHNQTRSSKFEFRNGRRFESIKTDEEKEDLLLWDYCIPDWKKLEDEDGVEIEPTAENKLMLMHGSPDFSSFVKSCLDRVGKDFTDREEDAPKN